MLSNYRLVEFTYYLDKLTDIIGDIIKIWGNNEPEFTGRIFTSWAKP
ncbi:hypothetical protein GAPWKB11_0169 [Gilliamella apicola]|nr:hypothetical protein GAPWKB11_0169 [Gilliamella apicola]